MIPDQRLSTTPQPAAFLSPDDEEMVPWIAKELGGADLYDSSEGLQVKTWTLRLIGGTDVVLSAPGSATTTLFSGAGITEVDLAFDQNMRPVVAYVEAGLAKLRWYDTLTQADVVTNFGASVRNPRVTLDDKRLMQSGSSDVILAYTRDNGLYFRAQRDRYGVEYLLQSDINARLMRVGMNELGRLQFMLETL